jgi:hypothetical protein
MRRNEQRVIYKHYMKNHSLVDKNIYISTSMLNIIIKRGWTLKNLTKQIDSSTEFFDVLCSSKDCCPNMKKSLLKEKRASTVYYPNNKNQVRKILMANKCVIRGGSTSYLGQTIPDKDEVIIDMSKFDSIKIMNDIAEVQAGTPFVNLIRMAALEGKELPVFPLSYRAGTPGGFLSNGPGVGIGSPENGFFHENIEEIEVVTPNSEILRLNGNDIADFSNSEGTLGVITSMKLKLQSKRIRYMHMYGFDSYIDLDRFVEESKNIRFAYFFNRIVGETLNDKWKLKDVPAYTVIVQDMNNKDDYRREFREDLSLRGISFIYPKWIVDLESARINMIEFMIKRERNFIHIGDAVGTIPNGIRALKIAEKYKIPVFGTLGKNQILLRFYFNSKDFIDQQKYIAIMLKVYRLLRPASRGRFFEKEFSGSNEWKRLSAAKTKYNITKNLDTREQLNKNNLLKKIFSPVLISIGGKPW